MTPHLRLLFAATLAAIGLSVGHGLARPPAAQACVWNVLHYFLPWPPCSVEDGNVIERVQQLNVRLAANLFEVGTKIQQARVEIRQWQRAYETATSYENTLKSVYGDLTANPLPSFVNALRNSNVGSWVELDHRGGFSLSANFIDMRAVADSIRDAFLDEVSVPRMWSDKWLPSIEQLGRQTERTAELLEDQLVSLGDYQARTQSLRDSLSDLGNRFARRYTGEATAHGDAEAHISHLSVLLSQLRGTGFETQTLAIHAQIRAIEMGAEKESIVHRRDGLRASLMVY